MKRQLQSSLENKQDRNRNECNITNSSTLDVQHSGLGVGRFLRAHMAVTDNKVSHVFKTLGTELQMCPIMSWDVLPGYKRCVGYGKLMCYFAETVKGSTKYRLRKSNYRVYGVIIPTLRAWSWVPPVSWSPTAALTSRYFSPSLGLLLSSRRHHCRFTAPAAAPHPQPPARGLLEAYRRHRPLPRRSCSVQGQRLQSAIPLCIWVPPHHAKGAIIIIKNKSSSLSIVCTYWPLLPSSQTHLQYSQKPWACLFSLCCLAWSRDKYIPCYPLPLWTHL